MSTLKRMEIPLGIFIIVSLIMIVRNYTGLLSSISDALNSNVVIVTTFFLVIGAYNLIRHQVGRVQRREKGWPLAILLLGTGFSFFILGFIDKSSYLWVQNQMLTPLQLAMLSYVGMYMYVAILRGARTRSLDSFVLLMITLIWALRQMPAGSVYVPIVTPITDWILTVLQSGATRAYQIGLNIGLLALIVRSWLGYERSWLGGD